MLLTTHSKHILRVDCLNEYRSITFEMMNYDFMVLRYDLVHVNMNMVLSTEQDQVHLLYKVYRLPKTLFIQGVCFYCTGSLLLGGIAPTISEPVIN